MEAAALPMPDFTPRDSHSLWYMSSQSTYADPEGFLDDAADDADSSVLPGSGPGTPPTRSRGGGQVLEHTALARLAAEEQQMQRHRARVRDFGSTWLRPLGVPKTLHQIREEKREQEEHQEALRREQLAQELAEAEGQGMPLDGDDDDDEEQQDLDDEIPDADEHFGQFDDQDNDDDDDDDDDDVVEERQNDLMAARMRMTDDALREALVRGRDDDMFPGQEEDEAHQGQELLLDETDFAGPNDDSLGQDEVEVDLDQNIPEAESGMYEHTDSEADLSSSISVARQHQQHHEETAEGYENDDGRSFAVAQHGGTRGGTSSPRESMDLSQLLSQDESSFMESSPAQRRRR